MPLKIDAKVTAERLRPRIHRLFELSADKILALEKSWKPENGAPVFTRGGHYTTRGWTEWTQGFQIGASILQYDATGEESFWGLGWEQTRQRMATHVSHVGVHDHGFNNISTYGQALRLFREGRRSATASEVDFCELALKVSGAIQAARWARIHDGRGFIYSFNGPHSLFIDTIRSLRSLGVAHQLGHVLKGEGDGAINLLHRLVEHALVTARYSIYDGSGRDAYDVRGRVAHECVFNAVDGQFRCPNSQQGYSPFSTWTRGLAWAICGLAEQLEFLDTLAEAELREVGGKSSILAILTHAATATADYYLEICCTDGIPYWDTGAPNLREIEGGLGSPADPFNSWEPVDSSAAVIAAQGLFRLGNHLQKTGDSRRGREYRRAGLTIAQTLFDEPYLSTRPKHQGLILHSVYHRPNGWDHLPRGARIPCGESSQWGDYHARELALLILREADEGPYPTFFACCPASASVS